MLTANFLYLAKVEGRNRTQKINVRLALGVGPPLGGNNRYTRGKLKVKFVHFIVGEQTISVNLVLKPFHTIFIFNTSCQTIALIPENSPKRTIQLSMPLLFPV